MKEYRVIHSYQDDEGYRDVDLLCITEDWDEAREVWSQEVQDYLSTRYDIDDEYHGTGHEVIQEEGWRTISITEGYYWTENELTNEFHIIEIEILED